MPDEAGKLLEGFPHVTILISHNSPRNVHDWEDGVDVGSDAFGDYVHRAEPKILFRFPTEYGEAISTRQ